NKVPMLLDPTTNNTIKAQLKISLTTATADLEAAVGDIGHIQDELAKIPREIEGPAKPASPQEAAALARAASAAANLAKMSDPATGCTAQHPKRVSAQRDFDAAQAELAKFGADIGKPQTEMQTNPDYFAKAQALEEKQAKERETRALVDS